MIDKDKQFKRQNTWMKENRDHINLTVPKGIKEAWKVQAEAEGLSLTEWIIKKCQSD